MCRHLYLGNIHGMDFFGVKKYFFRFAAQQNFLFATSCRDIIFFKETIIFKPQSANRIFLSAHFRDRNFFSSKFADRKFVSPKNHSLQVKCSLIIYFFQKQNCQV